jgi:DNA (cytosine-5)-methyltransferase 1
MTAILSDMSRLTARPRGVATELIVDNFAGAGGASLGIEAALGRAVDIAVNHSPLMLAIHRANHPHTRHLCEDVWDVVPLAVTRGRSVGLAWFSPDCKHFSKAKGGKPLSKRIRGLAWVVIRWAREVKPRVIILENVEEFVTWGPLDQAGNVIKAKKGQTFLRWKAMLRNLGYEVEHRELVAADFGVPTTRKRFFLIARSDGRPIRWPERTHCSRKEWERRYGKTNGHQFQNPDPPPSPRLRPRCGEDFRGIDDENVGRDIRPVGDPSVELHGPGTRSCDPGGDQTPNSEVAGGIGEVAGLKPWRAAAECIDWSLPCPSIFERKRPLAEATLRRIARGIVKYVINAKEPFIVRCAHGEQSASGKRWGSGEHGLDAPLPTLTASKDFALVSPAVVQTSHTKTTGRGKATWGPDEPLRTLTSRSENGLVESFLTKYHGPRPGELNGRSSDPADPIRTLDTQNRFGVVAATLMTNTTGHAATDALNPAPTLTSGGQQALAAAHLTKLYGTSRVGTSAENPLPTVTAGGGHIGEVRAFLVKYYSSGSRDQSVASPMHTLTAKARLGLVTVQGEEYQICDIGLRMLQPRELLAAQFGRFAREYVLTGTKAQQVAAIGNSVCPELAEAIVRANFQEQTSNAEVAEGAER